jgi:hypothetical protein
MADEHVAHAQMDFADFVDAGARAVVAPHLDLDAARRPADASALVHVLLPEITLACGRWQNGDRIKHGIDPRSRFYSPLQLLRKPLGFNLVPGVVAVASGIWIASTSAR